MALPQVSPGIYWTKPHRTITADGAEIHYAVLADEDQPPGPAVVLLSGFLCPDTWWHYLVPELLRNGYRVVMLHYRGIGTSSLPSDADHRSISIERFAEDALDVLHAAGIDRVSLIGHSMGGQVLVEVARRIPSRLDAVVSVTGAYRAPTRDLYGAGWLVAPAVGQAVRGLKLLPDVVGTTVWRTLWQRVPFLPLGRLATAFSSRTPSDVVASYVAHAAELPGSYFISVLDAMHRHDGSDAVPGIEVPALVITGDRDPFTPQAVAERMVELLPDGELIIVPRTTHGAILEEPDLINDAILTHLAKATGHPSAA